MGVMTAKQLVDHIQNYYTDDATLLVYWWDRGAVRDEYDDLCIDEDRVTEVWENAAELADSHNERGIDVIQEEVTRALGNILTQEEKDHENCIEIMTPNGSTIHKQMEELPPEEIVLRGRLVTDTFDS